MAQTDLHPSIISLISFSSMIASNHPNQGLCQLDEMREYGITQSQIDLVIEVARHFRDEAARKLDERFDDAVKATAADAVEKEADAVEKEKEAGSCCTPTKSGVSCC